MKPASTIPLVLSGALLIVVHLHADDDEATKNDPLVEVYADCHVHLLDFLQNGEFQNADHKFPGSEYGAQSATGRYASLPFGERGRRIEALLESMGRAKVRHALVMGMPFQEARPGISLLFLREISKRRKLYLTSARMRTNDAPSFPSRCPSRPPPPLFTGASQ